MTSNASGDFVRGKPAAAAAVAAPKAPRDASDNLFGVKKSGSLTGKRKGSNKPPQDKQLAKAAKRAKLDKKASDSGSSSSSSLTHAHVLTRGLLKPGMPMLGAVRAINDLDLTISLPDGLSGFLSLREVSDTMAARVDSFLAEDSKDDKSKGKKKAKKQAAEGEELPTLKQLFSVGQLVRCVILSVKKEGEHSRIELSARPSLFNRGLSLDQLTPGVTLSGALRSVEDRGFILELGVADAKSAGAAADDDDEDDGISALPASGIVAPLKPNAAALNSAVTGFLALSDAPADFQPILGRPVECVVQRTSGRTVFVSAKPEEVAKATIKQKTSQITCGD